MMKRNWLVFFTVFSLSLTLALPSVNAQHDEGTDGDLSGDIAAPTFIGNFASAGTFNVSGSVFDSDEDDTFAPGGLAGDFDTFTFNVAPGYEVTQILLADFSGAGQAFIGAQSGSVLTVNTTNDGASFPAVAAGFTLVDDTEIGNNILPDLIAGLPSFGPTNVPAVPFSGVISAGDTSFSVQNTGDNSNTYSLAFVVQAVPEPSSLVLLLGATCMCAAHRRRC